MVNAATTTSASASPSVIDWVNLGVTVGTFVAVVAAGVWTWWNFFRFRHHKPKAKITQTVTHRWMAEDCVLIIVVVSVRNIGSVLLKLGDGVVRLQQVHPCPQYVLDWIKEREMAQGPQFTEGDWPVLGERKLNLTGHEIEPNEQEDIPFDFLLGADTKALRVYSFIANESKNRMAIGWNATMDYDIPRLNVSESGSKEEVGSMSFGQEKQPPASPPNGPTPNPGVIGRPNPATDGRVQNQPRCWRVRLVA